MPYLEQVAIAKFRTILLGYIREGEWPHRFFFEILSHIYSDLPFDVSLPLHTSLRAACIEYAVKHMEELITTAEFANVHATAPCFMQDYTQLTAKSRIDKARPSCKQTRKERRPGEKWESCNRLYCPVAEKHEKYATKTRSRPMLRHSRQTEFPELELEYDM